MSPGSSTPLRLFGLLGATAALAGAGAGTASAAPAHVAAAAASPGAAPVAASRGATRAAPVAASRGAARAAPAAASRGDAPAAPSHAHTYAQGEVVVGYRPHTAPLAQAATARAVGAHEDAASGRTRVLHVAPGRVFATIAKLRGRPGVAFATADPIAHAAGVPTTTNPPVPTTPTPPTTPTTPVPPPGPPAGLPDDPGIPRIGGLLTTQWNFFGPWGVNAIAAWANAAAAGHAGASNVRIAVLDTGVAYRNYGRYKKSPDFAGTRFVAPWDFVARDRFPVDRNGAGHGTHVTSTIAETTGNGIGVSGLAWKAQIMPVRVLDSSGSGDSLTIAHGIRYAVEHHAQVINMSLEFPTDVSAKQMPWLPSAIRYATEHGALVVAATGNEGEARVAYPARASDALAVGATTDDGCLADFSNDGTGIGLVAPGGGTDAQLASDPNCKVGHAGQEIVQETYTKAPARFGLPTDFEGTSMAAPHVSGTAALVIASGVLGAHPTPAQLTCRLKATARQLGLPGPNRVYGYGLVDAGAATSASVATPQCTKPR